MKAPEQTREEIGKRIDELVRKYRDSRPEIIEELYKLAHELEKMEK